MLQDGQSKLDPHGSLIDDIMGDNYNGFEDSCWILLTS